MNKIFLWSVTVALAGFLFGFDTIVISGADQKLQALWNASDVFHGIVVMASALWGTVAGAMLGGIPTNKYGRKNTLIAIGVLFLVSAMGSAFANDPYTFAFFRFIGGLGIGASTIAAPAYISEIAHPQKRGRLVSMYQLSIVVGILTAFLSNYLLRNMGEESWRWMIGISAFPALIYGIAVLFIQNSPRWLLMKGRILEAENVLKKIDPGADINSFIALMKSQDSTDHESIFIKKYRRAMLLAFFIAFFNQLSGINAVLYYAPRIFEVAGLGSSSALLSSAGIGLINLLFTLIGMSLIDRLGRKHLMYIGSFGYIISLSLVALSFLFGWKGISVPVFLFVFIASHAIGQGTVIWVFIAELFPTHLRAQGQAFGSSVHWVLAAAIPSMIPFLFSTIGAGVVFVFFALMMVGQLFWVWFNMPETKGITLEEVSRKLTL
ncbi:MAG: sugar porter family MFS transporter [Chitinophagales bacterium]|nr:sugar porter family MFS transporter [Chitinophagales bacterium]